MDEKCYYIVNLCEGDESRALFWKPDRRGYTHNVDEAGLYTKEVADAININRASDIPIEKYLVDSLSQRCVPLDALRIAGVKT